MTTRITAKYTFDEGRTLTCSTEIAADVDDATGRLIGLGLLFDRGLAPPVGGEMVEVTVERSPSSDVSRTCESHQASSACHGRDWKFQDVAQAVGVGVGPQRESWALMNGVARALFEDGEAGSVAAALAVYGPVVAYGLSPVGMAAGYLVYCAKIYELRGKQIGCLVLRADDIVRPAIVSALQAHSLSERSFPVVVTDGLNSKSWTVFSTASEAVEAYSDGIGRWETAVRNIVTSLIGPRAEFEIDDIVHRVKTAIGEVESLRNQLANAERDLVRAAGKFEVLGLVRKSMRETIEAAEDAGLEVEVMLHGGAYEKRSGNHAVTRGTPTVDSDGYVMLRGEDGSESWWYRIAALGDADDPPCIVGVRVVGGSDAELLEDCAQELLGVVAKPSATVHALVSVLQAQGIAGAVADVREFHAAVAEHNPTACVEERTGDPALVRRVTRQSLLDEEFREYRNANGVGDSVEVLDALVDMAYVIIGTALIQFGGERFQLAWDAVHKSNMAKRWPDGTFHLREDGKVLKPPGWVGPDIVSIVLGPAPKLAN